MKNLTVNMPLAVPHQKPPSKYASHPYPTLTTENFLVSAKLIETGYLLPVVRESLVVSSKIIGVGELRSILQVFEFSEKGVNVSAKMVGSGELKGLLSRIDMDIEGVRVSAKISGFGELVKVLIRQNTKDNLNISAKITGSGVLL